MRCWVTRPQRNGSLLSSYTKQLDAAKEAGSCAIDLLPESGEEHRVCQTDRVVGEIYRTKGEAKKAIHHLEMALGIATSLDVADRLFWINYSLTYAFSEQGKFEDAQTHLEHAKSHAVNNAYLLPHAMDQQTWLWGQQCRPEDTKSEALRALDAFEKLGTASDAEATRLLHQIEEAALDGSNRDGELLETILAVHCIHSLCSDGIAESE